MGGGKKEGSGKHHETHMGYPKSNADRAWCLDFVPLVLASSWSQKWHVLDVACRGYVEGRSACNFCAHIVRNLVLSR